MARQTIVVATTGLALTLLIILAVQYPLSTTFPVGGDAASHVRTAQEILDAPQAPDQALLTLKSSNYPLFPLLFASAAALPISWPDRFVWWIVAGHLLTGAAIATLLWRIGSWQAAAAGLAIWALTPIDINTHFEAGTAPQLWSLIFLVLAFERLAVGSIWGTITMVILTTAAHFLSGFVLIASLIAGTIMLFPIRRRLALEQTRLIKYLGTLIVILIIFAIYKILVGISWPFIERQSEDFFLINTLKSTFAPWIVLSIPGIAILVSRLRYSLPVSTTLLSFFWFSFLLTTNSAFSVGLWENRFRTYLIVAVTIAAALALPTLSRAAFRSPITRALAIGTLFVTLTAFTWRNNAGIFDYYEDPQTYARLHPDVQEAIEWMAGNLPKDSYITSTAANRHTEWIPVLTPYRWQELNSSHQLLTHQGERLRAIASKEPFTHIIYLTDREDIGANLAAHPEWFPIVFENQAAVIMQLK